MLSISATTYANRIVPLLLAPELEGHSGEMFNASAIKIAPSPGLTPERVAKLVQQSEALVARADAAPPAVPAARK